MEIKQELGASMESWKQHAGLQHNEFTKIDAYKRLEELGLPRMGHYICTVSEMRKNPKQVFAEVENDERIQARFLYRAETSSYFIVVTDPITHSRERVINVSRQKAIDFSFSSRYKEEFQLVIERMNHPFLSGSLICGNNRELNLELILGAHPNLAYGRATPSFALSRYAYTRHSISEGSESMLIPNILEKGDIILKFLFQEYPKVWDRYKLSENGLRPLVKMIIDSIPSDDTIWGKLPGYYELSFEVILDRLRLVFFDCNPDPLYQNIFQSQAR